MSWEGSGPNGGFQSGELVAAWRHEDFLKPWSYPEIIEELVDRDIESGVYNCLILCYAGDLLFGPLIMKELKSFYCIFEGHEAFDYTTIFYEKT